jgi:hypothetical protein
MRDLIPVKCPKCLKKTLVISLCDKYYCLNDDCLFQARLPSEYEADANKCAERYYRRMLEEEVKDYRQIEEDGRYEMRTR